MFRAPINPIQDCVNLTCRPFAGGGPVAFEVFARGGDALVGVALAFASSAGVLLAAAGINGSALALGSEALGLGALLEAPAKGQARQFTEPLEHPNSANQAQSLSGTFEANEVLD